VFARYAVIYLIERQENAVEIFFGHADALIADLDFYKSGFSGFGFNRQADPYFALCRKFYGVVEQIEKYYF